MNCLAQPDLTNVLLKAYLSQALDIDIKSLQCCAMQYQLKQHFAYRTPLRGFAASLLFLISLISVDATAEATLVEIGSQLPNLKLRGLNGPSKSLDSYRGKPLIINVWASWCGPCRAEMESLEQLAWIEGIEAINIIGVSTDDYTDRAQAFLNSRNTAIRHYIDQALVIEKTLGAERLPLTVFIDVSGHVVAKVIGAKKWSSPKWVSFVKRTLLNNKASTKLLQQ